MLEHKRHSHATAVSHSCSLLFVSLQCLDQSLFRRELELRWELNVESKVEVAALSRIFNWHAFTLNKLARLRGNLLIYGKGKGAAIKSPERARFALESILQGDLVAQD